MKKKIILCVCFALCATLAMAQKPKGDNHHKERPHIEEIVDDLSQGQKRKLTSIREDSKKRIDALQLQNKAVRDSIHTLMQQDGDNSSRLFPLFEREGRIRAAISKEFYQTRLRIDEVLTKEQREKVRKVYSERHDKEHKKHPKGGKK